MGTRAAPTPDQVEAIRAGYAAGRSTYQLGAELGRSDSWVRAVMRQEGIGRRPVGDYRGQYHKDQLTYDGWHKRVNAARGKPQECSVCGTTEDRRYEWANLTGRYDDINDFARMCTPCHRTYDNARRFTDGS